MSVVLLDTTVASLLHPKKKADTRRASYEPHMQSQVLALSFQSVAELWQWAEENNWGKRERERLALFLQKFLVIPYDIEIAKAWAKLNVHCKKNGRRLEAGDAWIAATAIRFKLPLLTHDTDFVGLSKSQKVL
jgi:tRNA(fMet)-specific endonuclease VapC